MNKEERLALVRAGREDRGKYCARTAVKQKKVCLLLVFAILLKLIDNLNFISRSFIDVFFALIGVFSSN